MQYATWRPVLGLSLIAGALSPFVLSTPPLPLNTRALGEVHSGSLTTMQVGANAPIQDTRPRLLNRGTQLDGRLRSGPAQRIAIHANPFEDAWRAPTIGGIDLATGAYAVEEVDIALPATGFSWVVGRTYNARQEASGSHIDSNGVQGKNWFQSSQPSIVLYDTSGTANDMVYLMYGADRFAEYKRVVNGGITGDTFAGVNGAAGVFEFTSGGAAPDIYELTDQHGNVLTFFGFDGDAGVAAGQLWTMVDPAGNKAYVGHATSAASAITSGYDASGRMTTAYDTSGRRYSYTYTQLDSVYRLTEVKAEVNSGSWVTVAEVDYGYYTSESYGDPGDLKSVTLTTPLSDAGVSLTQKKYLRYYEGSYGSSNRGYPHALRYVFDFEGVRKFDWSDSTFDDDHLAASDASLQPYATAYFEYEDDGAGGQRRVTKAWFNGECGCSGANNGTHEFEYEPNGSFSGTAGYDTTWKERTVVKRPDLSYLTQYWDEVGQPLSQVLTDADPDNTSPAPSRWVTRVERDANGQVQKIATPANCTGYTHSSGAITASSSAGLIWEYVRETSGALLGFAEEKKYRVGTSGTLYYASETSFEQRDLEIASGAGAVDVTRPAILSATRYPQVTSSSSATYKDEHDPTWDGTDVLSLVSDSVTEPAIATGNNGSGTANTYSRHFRVDGTPSFRKERDGSIEYREYTNGQLTEQIEDADTDVTGDFDVSVGSLSSPNGYHKKTTFAYDAQGRFDLVTAPDGRKTKHYYSKLLDGLLVHVVYADYETSPSTKFFGPAQYTVTNQAGNVEVRATVALTNNESTTALTGHVDETDADPITAMDLGTVVRLATEIYNESGGTMEESRLYFDIPASGAGTDGTNYDATLYGYDDSGRRTRVKEAHGTITRTTYDKLGRVTARFIGTNDHDFAGGEASGTDNMVQTEALEFDGNDDDGNGYLTERTLYVEDGSSGQRETTYANDAFGRVLLQTNPTAPHAFHKYDNEGRSVATGLFSSTGSIVVGTDDPTTETANRLALTESYFDEVGQLWKSVRHKIDASDGSDDDSLLHSYWRDAAGRVVKEDGPQLTKTFYDRIGRVTHRFILMSDNDSAYSDVDDVTGDYVVEETQTVYESEDSDDVLMTVRHDRKHDDPFGGSGTTGALDTGADADVFLLTSSNVKGRAQVTALWYDRFGRVTDEVQYGHSPGFDVKYTMDDLDRLIDGEEGTRSGSDITSRTRHQTWLQSAVSQLSHTGNWARSKLDLDGDDNWNETEEYDDTRTHNKVNELTARDTDTNGTNNYTLSYDAAGNLTDDAESYEYEYDAFYRLRKVKNQSSTLLAEYRYNGLGHMIGVHEDTDADGDADGSDVWFYPAYDEAWREVARYRQNDSSPKEQFVNATAGLDGYGGSSYINDVVCRNRDANSGWTAASDGTLEERYFYCPNWRGDVSALVSSGRQLHEMDKYSPYGIPFGLPGGDTNSDGDNDSADATQIQTWIDTSTYDVRGNIDLDGDVDSTDKTLAQGTPIAGNTMGRNALSDDALRQNRGSGGYQYMSDRSAHIRHRHLHTEHGQWGQRDPFSYLDSFNLYEYATSSPISNVDPSGEGIGDCHHDPHGPPHPPHEVDDPCLRLKRLIRRSGRPVCCESRGCIRGKTSCYGPGMVVSCVFCPAQPGNEVSQIIHACLRAHENHHERNADCTNAPPGQFTEPANDPEAAEAGGYRAQLDCLMNSASLWCGTTDEEAMAEELDAVCDRGAHFDPTLREHPACASPCTPQGLTANNTRFPRVTRPRTSCEKGTCNLRN